MATHTNRLANEKSPYLLQHAHNPVDWFPWGPEAFEKARRENKPIFLSIGYSTCHWCHVMERESFENEAVAAVLNQHFVCIKVDREERPDIDKIYMTATLATTGGGGWPMSVWLTPDLKPFYCGTYFPPPQFVALLERIHEVWEANRDGVLDQANRLTEALTDHLSVAARSPDRTAAGLDDTPLKLGLEQFRQMYDPEHGGFGGAPKFPRPVVLNFLFRVGGADMALHTLRKMGEGGLFDHLGGGFHRYSVDERWLVSHFEKMLYDQAQLVCSYVDAYQLTRDEFYADIARRTCDYVLRDMTSPDGGFYSAEDADSEGVEGKFYVWTRQEVEQILGERAEEFCRAYDVDSAGNWEHGLNVLHVVRPGDLAEERAKLFAARQKRVRPHRDEKIITAWNGLMISALARTAQAEVERASRSLSAEPNGRHARSTKYLAAAQKAARRYDALPHLIRCGSAPAVVDDYAFLANGLLDLYETDFDPRWLQNAIALADQMIEKFYDRQHGGFYMTDGRDPSVILRAKEDYDGAEPSGNSVAALLLLRLAEFGVGAADSYRQAAEKTLILFTARMHSAPHILPQMLCALDFYLARPKQIVIAGKLEAADTQALLRVVRERYRPNKVVLLCDGRPSPASWLQELPASVDRATAYVCAGRVCQLPTSDPEQLRKLLE